ncbi:MAG: heme biosynthesis HemY N-terminal domain-containing protein [Rhodospirillales bacterium]
MIRILGYLVGFGLLAVLSVWLSEHSQPVSLTLMDYRVDTSLGMLIGIIVVLSVVFYRLWTFVIQAPASIARAHHEGKRRRGYLALTRGMVAVAAGDSSEAERQVKRADVLLNDPPLTMLLSAQAAQLNGDEKAARKFFRAMLNRPETEFLGLRGLFAQALKQDNMDEALQLAHRAHRLKPGSEWVATNLFKLQTMAGQWMEAEETLYQSLRKKIVTPGDAKRRRAILCHQISIEAANQGNPKEALKRARMAHDLDQSFMPAAERLARLLADSGKVRKAAGLIEKVWQRNPHPSLLEVYWAASKGEDAMARLRAIKRLARFNPDHRETHIAMALAALEARIWGEARKHLEAAAGDGPEVRVCRLMAELEESEHGDLTAARQWLVRASLADPDPAWVCNSCGNASSEWSVMCAKCSSFDSLDWQTPAHIVSLADLAPAKALPSAAPEPNKGDVPAPAISDVG